MQEIRAFLSSLEKIIGAKSYTAFKTSFSNYKRAVHPSIDDFTKELFDCFFGEPEVAVCHLEVQDYVLRKQMLIKLRSHVEQRHQDRYEELIFLHF